MFLDFPVFAVAFGRHKENEAAKAGYLVVAGGGGSAKSGVQNTIAVCQLVGSASNAKLQVKFSLDTGRDLIHQVDIAPLGDLIACSVGDSCQLFSLSKHSFSLKALTSFRTDFAEEDASQNVVRFGRTGGILGTGGDDGVVRLWELSSSNGRPRSTLKGGLKGHGRAVTDLSFCPSGELLASISKDGTARVWRLHDAAPLCQLPVTDNALKPATLMGRTCRFAPREPHVLYTVQSAARGPAFLTVWTPSAAAPEERSSSASSANGSSAAVGSSWDPGCVVKVADHPASTFSVSGDGAYLGFGCTDGSVCVWRRPEMVGSRCKPPTLQRKAARHEMPVTGAVFLPNSYVTTPEGRSGRVATEAKGTRGLFTGSADYSCSLLPVSSSRPSTLVVFFLFAALLVIAFAGGWAPLAWK